MSLYRFFRTSALLALAGKYRNKLYRVATAITIALVTAWLYTDITLYLQNQRPEWLGSALLIKTVVVYGALFYAFWQIRPGAWSSDRSEALPKNSDHRSEASKSSSAAAPTPGGPLDELMDKPKLQSRKDAILTDSKHGK